MIGRIPGSACSSVGASRATSSSSDVIGTDTSCLIVGPSDSCASETRSRSAHRPERWAGDPAMAASSTRPASTAAPSAFSRSSSTLAPAGPASSIRPNHVGVECPGERVVQALLEHELERRSGDQLPGGEPLRGVLTQEGEE